MGIKRFFYDPAKRPRSYSSRRPLFKSSSILSYTENDLAIMAKFASNGKMAGAVKLFENMTPTELKMQEAFQSNRFKGHPCYPQTLAFGYILDFYFPLAGLAIEADGKIHERQKYYDRKRGQHLKARGIETLRIKNEAFEADPESVLKTIEKRLAELSGR